MGYSFDAANKRIVLTPGTTAFTAQDCYSRWKEWAQANSQYEPAFRVVGGDPIGGGLFVASYFFLINGWRVRPFEGNHTLVIDGNLIVDGGGVPVVQTLGAFNVSVQYTVPVQAQAVATQGGSSGGLTSQQAEMLESLAKIHGLIPGVPLTVSANQRQAGDLVQSITESSGTTTVTRL